MTKKNNDTQSYWFYLNDRTYLSIIGKTALLYRTDINKRLIINSPELVSYLTELENVSNMGVISLDAEMLQSDEMVQLMSLEFGFVAPKGNDFIKPARIPQICKINVDYEKGMSGNEDVSYQLQISNITKNLIKLTIFMNDDGMISTTKVDYTKYFESLKKTGFIDFRLLSEILTLVSGYPINTIDLCGPRAIAHPDFSKIVSAIHNIGKQVCLTINCDEISIEECLNIDKLNILVDGGFNPVKLNRIVKEVDLLDSRFIFRVKCMDDIDSAYRFIDANRIDSIVIPFWDGKNSYFLHSVLEMDVDDIFSRPITRREIFRNQKLNSNLFGHLYVLPNGNVFSNLADKPIGDFRTDIISKIIHTELEAGTVWRKTRDDVSCNSCIYKFLCPPPSEYEISMKNYHLCNIN